MKTSRLAFSAACAGIALTTNVAQGFSIAAVTFAPSNSVPPGVELQMTVDIITPTMPEWLYAATQVSSNATGLHVDIFPSSGWLTAIGGLQETVPLGKFPAGTYNYEVILHPDYQVGWGTRTNRGVFSVGGAPPPGPTNHPPSVSISFPTNNQSFAAHSNILVLGGAHDDDGYATIQRIEFFEGTNSIGFGHFLDPAPTDVAILFFWTNVPPGNFVLTAQVTDDGGATATSMPVSITVLDPSSRPRILSILNAAGNGKRIIIAAVPGQVYSVQGSTNLVQWGTLGTATETESGTFEFEDTQAAAFPSRYYRVVSP
jgi:hypothetical protein